MSNLLLNDDEREKLSRARVGIAGAGGLGSNCAMLLARAGVGHLTVCDFDVVSESNLNRQFYFRDQLGMRKTEALEANLKRIAPEMEIDARAVKLDGENSAEIFSACDIVVEAFDSADAKMMFYGAMLKSGKRIVGASGMAGWGRSNAIKVRKMGENLTMAGDGTSAVGGGVYPQSARVAIVSAMEANSVLATILGKEI